MRVLVTGGVRSGKSAHAERLLGGHDRVTYVAAGRAPDPASDPEWAQRVAAHRARRPATWETVEATELDAAVREATAPVLVDCLGTWLTGLLDRAAAWDVSNAGAAGVVEGPLAALTDVVSTSPVPVVLVTNEVGWGVVPAYRSGRLFADLLGRVNQQVAAVCDEVHLVVAGRVLVL